MSLLKGGFMESLLCNGLTFRSVCESPGSDLARWTPEENKEM